MAGAFWRAGKSPLTHPGAAVRAAQGVSAWDAGWYRAIALHGYSALGPQSTRFFPVWPGVLRGLHIVGVPIVWSMVVVTSGLWLGALVAVDGLAGALRMGAPARSTTLWLLCLWPGAVATVLGYAEPLMVLVVATVLTLAVSSRGSHTADSWRWLLAGCVGVVAGATRPVGILLVIPLVIEAIRQHPRGGGAVVARLVGVAGPAVGLCGYLLWCRHAFGDALLPLHVQTQAAHHGGLTNPVSGLLGDVHLAFEHHLSDVLHLPFVLVAIVLCVLAFWRTSLSIAAFSAAIVVVALSGHNLDSFERYVLVAPGVFFAAASLLERKPVRLVVLLGLGATLFAYSFLALGNVVVP
jgi:hypothetical protein